MPSEESQDSTRAADLADDEVMGDRLTFGLGGRGHWVDIRWG